MPFLCDGTVLILRMVLARDQSVFVAFKEVGMGNPRLLFRTYFAVLSQCCHKR